MKVESLPIPFVSISPAMPVSATGGTALDASVDDSSLDMTVGLDGDSGNANVTTVLPGELSFEAGSGTADDTVILTIRDLGTDGRPREVYPILGFLREDNPQLTPFPARVRYTYPGARDGLETALEEYARAYAEDSVFEGVPPRVTTADGEDERASSPADLATRVIDNGARVLVDETLEIGTVSDAEEVTIRTRDLRHYGVPNLLLAVVETGANISSGTALDGVYRVEDCDQSNNLEPESDAPDFSHAEGATSTDAFGWREGNYETNNRNNRRQRLVLDRDELLAEHEVVLEYTSSGSTSRERVDLDRFEKFGFFRSDLRWHLRNWRQGGFLSENDWDGSLKSALGMSLYPDNYTTQLTRTEVNGIDPPDPTITDYDDGESDGEERPTYDFDVQRFHFAIQPSTDYWADAPMRDVSEYEFEGADGYEQYVRAVIASEFEYGNTHNTDDELQALLGQAICSRTYVLHRWLDAKGGTGGLSNPIATDYAKATVGGTARFQVVKMYYHTGATGYFKSQAKRRGIQEAIATTRGLMATCCGQIIDTEFFAGDSAEDTTCDVGEPYKFSVQTPHGVDCSRVPPSGNDSAYMLDHGHGRGYSQDGSRDLSLDGLSHIQLAHWYYYGIQLRNGWGKGDIVTDTPSGDGWLDGARPFDVPTTDVSVSDGDWMINSTVGSTDAANWYLSHNFRISEFFVGASNGASSLSVSTGLVERLQGVRYRAGAATIQGFDRTTANDEETVTIENTDSNVSNSDFEQACIEEFGASDVSQDATNPAQFELTHGGGA